MNKRTLLWLGLFASWAIYLYFLATDYSMLPERVAQRFSWTGQASQWVHRQTYIVFEVFLAVVVPLVTVLLAFVLKNLNTRFTHIPNRDYWLSQKNIARTQSLLQNAMLVIAISQVLFMLQIHWMIVAANKVQPAFSSGKQTFLAVAFLLAGVFGSLIYLNIFFKKVPKNE